MLILTTNYRCPFSFGFLNNVWLFSDYDCVFCSFHYIYLSIFWHLRHCRSCLKPADLQTAVHRSLSACIHGRAQAVRNAEACPLGRGRLAAQVMPRPQLARSQRCDRERRVKSRATLYASVGWGHRQEEATPPPPKSVPP